MKRPLSRIIHAIATLTLTACTLTEAPAPPPIIEPRTTPTPTPAPQNTAVAQSSGNIEVELISMRGQIQEDRLMVHVATLANFYTRHVNSPSDDPAVGIAAAANYLERQFQQIEAESSGRFSYFEHTFELTYDGLTTTQRNVAGVLPGTQAGAGVIVVGAHYDSRTWSIRDATGFAPGADDNASGVAAVIEIARVMAVRPRRATIIFVLFSAEEVGRHGSIAFVEDYLKAFEIDDVMMLNLDTIGSWNDSRGRINNVDIRLFSASPNDSPSRALARSINFAAYYHELDLNVALQDAIDRPGRFGDHFSFEEAGYPAVRFIEALEDEDNREGADTVNHIEPAYLAASTRTVIGVLESLADGVPPPQSVLLRPNGDGTASAVWEPVPEAARYVVALRRPDSLIFDRHFIVDSNRTEAWAGWYDYEAFAVAVIDRRGLVGRFAPEVRIER